MKQTVSSKNNEYKLFRIYLKAVNKKIMSDSFSVFKFLLSSFLR